MAELALKTRELDFHLEQVQDFTPTPMTVATEIYYSGIHPYTGEKIFTAVRPEEKLAQRQYFFWYDRTYRQGIVKSLNRLHRPDLLRKLFPGGYSDIRQPRPERADARKDSHRDSAREFNSPKPRKDKRYGRKKS